MQKMFWAILSLFLFLFIHLNFPATSPLFAAMRPTTEVAGYGVLEDLPCGTALLSGRIQSFNAKKDLFYLFPDTTREFFIHLNNLSAQEILLYKGELVKLKLKIVSKSSDAANVQSAEVIAIEGFASERDIYERPIKIINPKKCE
ncbi:MAG: hypothetical protein HQK50_15685 [Oligoflexia bacterium]|nr:hypothetical protein [Oligoflexia bacterium]MBF0367015.1 hypothetical protein [Oligoflexia bacterium]